MNPTDLKNIQSVFLGKNKYRSQNLAKFELVPLSSFGKLILFLFNWRFGQTSIHSPYK